MHIQLLRYGYVYICMFIGMFYVYICMCDICIYTYMHIVSIKYKQKYLYFFPLRKKMQHTTVLYLAFYTQYISEITLEPFLKDLSLCFTTADTLLQSVGYMVVSSLALILQWNDLFLFMGVSLQIKNKARTKTFFFLN